jgi:hypothetical protein
MSDESKPRKTSSVRHTRAIQRDRSKRPGTAPPDEKVEALLEQLIHPATYAQVAAFQAMGMRQRILTLPVMWARVEPEIWPGRLGGEAARELKRRVWVEALPSANRPSRNACAPFQRTVQRILKDILPQMQQRWQARQRHLAGYAWGLHFPECGYWTAQP